MASFTGDVDSSISSIWNRINLCLELHCVPSAIDNESHRDIQAIKVILSAREELRKRDQGN